MAFTQDFAAKKRDKAEYLLYDTLDALCEMDVVIITQLSGYEYRVPIQFDIASHSRALPFIILEASLKALKLLDIGLKGAEFVILDNGDFICELVLYNIYKNVNRVTVITARPDYFTDISRDIYSETGLKVRFEQTGKLCLQTADIIINAAFCDERGIYRADRKYDYHYKRGSAYFDLSGDRRIAELARKREDMLVCNGVGLKRSADTGTGMFVDMRELDMVLYVGTPAYRRYTIGRFDENDIDVIIQDIYDLGLHVNSFTLNGRTLANAMQRFQAVQLQQFYV